MGVEGAGVLASGFIQVIVAPALVIIVDPVTGEASALAPGSGAGCSGNLVEVPPGKDVALYLQISDQDLDFGVLDPGIARISDLLCIY